VPCTPLPPTTAWLDPAGTLSGGDASGGKAGAVVLEPCVVVMPPKARPNPVGAVGGSDAHCDLVGTLFLLPYMLLPSPTTRLFPTRAVGSGIVRGDEAGAVAVVARMLVPTRTARTGSRGAVGGDDASGDAGSTYSCLPLAALLPPTKLSVPTGVVRERGVRSDEAGASFLFLFVVLPPFTTRAIPAVAVCGDEAEGDEVRTPATVLPIAPVADDCM